MARFAGHRVGSRHGALLRGAGSVRPPAGIGRAAWMSRGKAVPGAGCRRADARGADRHAAPSGGLPGARRELFSRGDSSWPCRRGAGGAGDGVRLAVPLWLTEQDVRAVLSLPELIGAMESALAAFSTGKVDQPVRTAIEVHDRTFFASMPAYDGAHGILGAKLVTVFPENAARGLHTHLAAISLFDSETGELTAVMDGRYITEVRTAAASAVSVRHLAQEDAAVLAILGSGVQARSHLDALPLVRPFHQIRAWSPTPEHL